MKETATYGALILLCDCILSMALRVMPLLFRCSCFSSPAGIWALGGMKWIILKIFTSMMTDGRPQEVLRRLVLLLCLLSPVMDSMQMLIAPPLEPYMRPLTDLSVPLLVTFSSTLACLVCEMSFRGDGKTTKPSQDKGQLLVRMLKYFRPDVFYLIAAFSFLILGVVCDSFMPLYQGKVIDMLRGEELHLYFSFAVGQLALLSLGSALFSGMRGGVFMCVLARLNKRLKHLLFQTLLQQEVHFFEENKPGRLSSRLHSDVDRMGRTVALNANALVRSTVKTVLMLVVMLKLSFELTVLTCIEMPLLAIIENRYIGWSKEVKDQIQECHAQNKDLVLQTISGIHTVRSFKGEKEEMRRYDHALSQMNFIKGRSGIYKAIFLLIRRLVSVGIKVLMLLQARRLISAGQLSIGSLVSFFLYQKPMAHNLREILYCYGETISTLGVISKVFSYFDRKPQWKKAGELAPETLKGRVTFQNVTFTYPSAAQDTLALKSVSMELKPGQMTALVGPSGSGKTSCVSLLKRLYEPQEGQILLDGQPLHHYRHKYLHQKMALVSQNPVLFSGSLRYNLEYGLKDSKIEKVKEAVMRTGAENFISELDSGYNTDIGEGGGKLSEGQKQYIAIIRALVREPQVIILDEATSKLDVEAQHAALCEVLSAGRTVLVVAHQLKTVEKADHIIFLERGEVVERGTHQELMSKRGRYYRLKEELFS